MATRAGTIYKQHKVTQTTNTTEQEEMAMEEAVVLDGNS